MAKILDVTNCLVADVATALTSPVDFCRVQLAVGGVKIFNRPGLWSSSVPDIAPYHTNAGYVNTPDGFIYFVRDGLIGGAGSTLKRHDHYLYSSYVYPLYVKHYIENNLRPLSWGFEESVIRNIEEPIFHIMHFNMMYGHWLLEILPKLFAIKRLKRLGIQAPILLSKNVPDYVPTAIQLIDPDQDVCYYDPKIETIRASCVILPPMLHLDYIFDAAWPGEIHEFLRNQDIRASKKRKIYISRSHISDKFRLLTNSTELDELALRLGFEVIRPESLPWIEQIRIFASAELIVGEYGSGMHNSIFSQSKTNVVCFNILGKIQSRIGNSFEQNVGYLLDPDGQPRHFVQGWSNQQAYRIDPNELVRKISNLI